MNEAPTTESVEATPEEKDGGWLVPILVMVGFALAIITTLFVSVQRERGGLLPPTEPPPGYRVACDSQGRFAFMLPGGTVWDYENDVSKDKTKVLRKAWFLYNMDKESQKRASKLKPRIESDWHDCEAGK